MSGIVNSYSTISQRYPYPIKYYMLQDITGTFLEVYSYINGNVFSVRNPIQSTLVPDVGVIKIQDSTSNINIPISNISLNSLTLEYFTNALPTSRVSLGDYININLSTTLQISYFTRNTTINIPPPVQNWYHVACSSTPTFFVVFLNGNQVYSLDTSGFYYPSLYETSNLIVQSTSYIADLRVSNVALYRSEGFTLPKCPLPTLKSTCFLLSGNFNQTLLTRKTYNTLGLSSPNPHNFTVSGGGEFNVIWSGWLKFERTNTLNLTAQNGKMFMAVGSNGNATQIVNSVTNGSKQTTFNVDYSNVYAPVLIYLKNSINTICTLNGKNIIWSNIQNAQLSNTFKLYNTVGGVLKNTTPPDFGTTSEQDLILFADEYSLKVSYGNFLGYRSGFTLSSTRTNWVFQPTPKENTYTLITGGTNVSNVSIFLK